MMHRDDQKLQVQQATDIVRLIGEEVALRPRGREFMGLCPFHDDKRPSLHVSPVKQIYKCFSCGAGGDVFSFMMMYHKMTFPEALAHLAERAGVTLTRSATGHGTGQVSARQQLSQANDAARQFFSQQLAGPAGRVAREYVKARGVTPATVEAFQIGYAPDQWDGFVGELGRRGLDRQVCLEAGLTVAKRDGQGVYDRFRHRLVFPICDAVGRTIAFGARRLREQDEPKYLNSPESPLFNKSTTLYGLHLAKKSIIDSRLAVVVEGYTDVVACHQAGVKNVIATLGTAFTRGHADVLGRLCDKVVLVFDADQAGQKAADRAVDVFFSGSTDVAVAVLPEGQDPAQLLGASGGLERFEQLLADAVDALEYKLARMRDELGDTDTLTGRERVGQRYLRELVEAGGLRGGEIRGAMVAGRVAQLLGIGQQTVEAQLRKLAGAAASAGRSGRGAESGGPQQPQKDQNIHDEGVVSSSREHRIRALQLAERHVIGCLLRRPSLFHEPLSSGTTMDEALTPAEMVSVQGKKLYGMIHGRLSDGGPLTLTRLLADLAADGLQEMASLATDAESRVEALCGDSDERLEDVIQEAVASILRYHTDRAYQQERRALFEAVSNGPQAVEDSELSRLVEHRRNHPSAVHIARFSGGG